MSDTRLAETLEILEALVTFDTVSSKSNLPLLEYVEAYLARYGVQSRRYPSDCGTKANLWATIGPDALPGVIWSGHTDVVPVDGQAWETDPFCLMRNERDEVIGRGVTDMKGFLACCLALVPQLTEAPLSRPIHLCFSYDEEVGCIGVRSAINDLANWPVKPIGCIVGEPSNSGIVTGHKAKRSFRVEVAGLTGHSSLAPQAVNAVHFGARLINHIVEIADDLEMNGLRDPIFSVPHSTAHVGLVQGGTQLNIVPERCYFDFEFRVLPQSDPDELVKRVRGFADTVLLPLMRVKHADADIRFDIITAFPGLDIAEDHPWVSSMMRCAKTNEVSRVSYGAEAGLFQTVAGIPTVICGPGNIEDAHKPNERLAISELKTCLDILERAAFNDFL